MALKQPLQLQIIKIRSNLSHKKIWMKLLKTLGNTLKVQLKKLKMLKLTLI